LKEPSENSKLFSSSSPTLTLAYLVVVEGIGSLSPIRFNKENPMEFGS
jgi:hypothetical protein